MAVPSRSRGASVKLNRRRGASHSSSYKVQHILYILVAMTLLAAFGCMLWIMPSSTSSKKKGMFRRSKRVLPDSDNVHNSLALDIISSLQCEQLQDINKQNNLDDNLDDEEENRRRRLEQSTDDFENNNKIDDDDLNNEENNREFDFYTPSVNAKHLLCLAAASPNLPSYVHQTAFTCNVDDKRQALLDLWASARTQMSLPLLEKTLEMAQETSTTLFENFPISLSLWMPAQDLSLEFLQNVLNDESCAIRNLPLKDSDSSLFVDVGSGLGLTTLAVAKKYPNTRILSIEPAAPSWLLQKLNVVCNLSEQEYKDDISVTLAGVGSTSHKNKQEQMAKLLWRPSQTRLTRTWTSHNETSPEEDVELVVKLVSLRSLVAEYMADYDLDNKKTTKILNLDCEGCEYNVVPSMSEPEFQSYSTIIGTTGVHWGYIPMDKLPSSKRAEQTHSRLCQHYDYARQCMECCAFPQLKTTKRTKDQEVTTMTVQQASGDLCGGFAQFAENKLLYASNDDYGWTELSSMSHVE